MNKDILKEPFVEISNALNDLVTLDCVKRSENNKTLLDYEIHFKNNKVIIDGILSCLRYMHLSVIQIDKLYDDNYFLKYNYTEYDFYRYHYGVFCHNVSTIHDLYFKLIAELCNFSIKTNKIITWESMRKELTSQNEIDIIKFLEKFFSITKELIDVRNKLSHQGLISSSILDDYHIMNIYDSLILNFPDIKNLNSLYVKGTKENNELKNKDKEIFINTLEQCIQDITNYTKELFNLMTSKLINMINQSFLKEHKKVFEFMNLESVNKYILKKEDF